MKLGLVTYNMAKEWDIPTIIERCEATGFQGVELRTTHAHNVEVDLSASERRDVRKQFEDSAIEIAGLGSAFEFHSPDNDELRQNIEGTKLYSQLAADVGAPRRQGPSERFARRRSRINHVEADWQILARVRGVRQKSRRGDTS